MRITPIFTLADSRLAPYAHLSDRQLRSLVNPGHACMILESLFVIKVALASGIELKSLFVDERHIETLVESVPELARQDIEVFVASKEVMSELTGINKSRGYLACARRPQARTVAEVLADARRIAVLEGLVDVSNVGAVFRSAAALGIDGVLLAPTCADPLNRRAVRVSMGTVFQVPWAQIGAPWPAPAFEALKEKGFTTCALALREDALRLDDPALAAEDKLALFFGNEGWGLTDGVLSAVDKTVIIPMSAGVDSLNVAASSAVAFWQLCSRQ